MAVTPAARLEAAIRAVWNERPELRWNASATSREVLEVLGWPALRLRSVRRAVGQLAKLASETGITLEEEASMVKKLNADDLGALVGRDVEARCSGGGCYRGTLQAVGDDFLRIARSTTARAVYVRRSGLVALVDETPTGLQAVGRRVAEAALGDGGE